MKNVKKIKEKEEHKFHGISRDSTIKSFSEMLLGEIIYLHDYTLTRCEKIYLFLR